MSQPIMVSGTAPPPDVATQSRWQVTLPDQLSWSIQTDRLTPTIRLYLDNIRRTPGPFTDEDFNTSEEAVSVMERLKVLLVYANAVMQTKNN